MPPATKKIFVCNAVLLTFLYASICHEVATLGQKDLWLECSCMYASERNATNWGYIAINGSTLRGAKNDCYLIFIAGGNDELVAFRFQTLQLSGGYAHKNTNFARRPPRRRPKVVLAVI